MFMVNGTKLEISYATHIKRHFDPYTCFSFRRSQVRIKLNSMPKLDTDGHDKRAVFINYEHTLF